MNASLNRIVVIVLSIIFVGCSDKDKGNNEPVNLAGAYYTDKIQHTDHYEPETQYVFGEKGKVVVTYIYEITDFNGQPLIYREIYVGSYSVAGSKVSVTDFKTESVCKGDKEGNKPLDFTVSFKKQNGSLVLGSGDETLTLKPLNKNRIKKFAKTKLCTDLNITSENVGKIEPSPVKPEIAEQDKSPIVNGGENIKTVVLPPAISPVIIRPPSNDKVPDLLVPYIEFDNESWVKQVVDAAKVECIDSEECPSFVGLFIGKRRTDKIQMYQCSATYLGDGYFSTNSHCYHRDISRYTRSFVQNCSDEIWVKMPATDSYKAQTLNCEKVIYLTEMVPRSLVDTGEDIHKGREAFDVMIFKVKEKVNRPKAVVNFDSSVEIGEELTAWTVNPTNDKPGINGLIEKKTCKAYDHNNKREIFKLDEQFSNSLYRAVHVNECDKKMMKGNSGSTLFNKDSQGVAVFSHIYVDGENQIQSNRGYGTPYTCLGEINDGDRKVFGGSNMSRCRTLSNKDIGIVRENLRIREHNEVVAVVRKIHDILKRVYNESQTIIGGKVNPDRSLVKEEINSSVPGVSFGAPVWVSGLKQHKSSPLFRYAPTKRFDEETMGMKTENGQIIFDKSVIGFGTSMLGNSVETSLDDFSVYELQLPSCIRIKREELSRRRTDNRLNPFSAKTYEYDRVRITLPIDVYVADYQLGPRLITDQNIDLIKLQRGDIKASSLDFNVYFEILKSGSLSELKFGPVQNLETNELANKIKNAVKSYCR